MSTHGIVARAVGVGWKGVYVHSDGYPTVLGARLWELYHGHFAQDGDALLRFLIEAHPGGWSELIGSPKLKPGQPRSHYRVVPAHIEIASPAYRAWQHKQRMPCHCHDERGKAIVGQEKELVADGEEDAGEWFYVFSDPALVGVRPTMTVYRRVPQLEGWGKITVATIDLADREPDWAQIEQSGEATANAAWETLANA